MCCFLKSHSEWDLKSSAYKATLIWSLYAPSLNFLWFFPLPTLGQVHGLLAFSWTFSGTLLLLDICRSHFQRQGFSILKTIALFMPSCLLELHFRKALITLLRYPIFMPAPLPLLYFLFVMLFFACHLLSSWCRPCEGRHSVCCAHCCVAST